MKAQKRSLQGLNEQLENSLKFEQLLSRISAGLINLPPDKILEEIEESFQPIADALKLDLIALFEFSGEGAGFIVTHAFGYKRTPELTGSQLNLILPWYAETLRNGDEIIMNNVFQDAPEDAWAEREFCHEQDIGSHVGFPLTVGEKIVGGLGFSSSSPRIWSDELLRQLRLLAEIFGNTLHRRQIQSKIEDLLDFERMVSETSALFVNLPADAVDNTIRYGLGSIGKFLNADRCSLYQFSKLKAAYRVRHTWAGEGTEPAPIILRSELLPWVTRKWINNETVLIENADDLPEEADTDKETLKQFGVGSHLSVPLAADRTMAGALAIVTIGRHQAWPEEYVQRLTILGRIFANALIRKRAEQELNSAFLEIKQLKEQIEADYSYLREEIRLEHNFEEIIGQSHALKYVLLKIEQIAPTDVIVLIQGETGTGKELVARAIHNAGLRNNRPLVKVNCAALPSNLIESELFGYEKGAFTGANTKQLGRFGLADGGTIFLDEIGELPLELQPKLLRVLQEGEFERLGDPRTVTVDVRIIAATNRNLEEEVRKGRFRQDLWYRLNVFPITVPPLRERREDIPMLVEWFVSKVAKKLGKEIRTIHRASMRELESYSWPGNVRELQNVIERAVLNTRGPILQLADKLDPSDDTVSTGTTKKTLAQVEKEYILQIQEHILQILKECNWKIEGKNGAAETLDINPGTLRSRMKKLGIKRSEKIPDRT
jgi:transcriptional regulator with GAF, ATPase, and Fis domain